jgi:AraC-like DNA-binding protein
MAQISAPLLERLRIFHSQDAEETRAFLGGKNYRLNLPRKLAGPLDTRINGIHLPQSYVGYIQYGAASVTFSPAEDRQDYWVQLPVRGNVRATVGHDDVACTPNRAAISSPTSKSCSFLVEADSARIQMALDGAAVNAQLAALLGEPAKKPVDFTVGIDLSRGHGRSLAFHVLMAVTDLDQAGSVLWDSRTGSAFEQFITIALLLSHPHNHSEALDRLNKAVAPRGVRRAVDYMHSHLHAQVTLADIVEASGVPGRTLFRHFMDWRGVSPMRHLRNVRLAHARQALLRASPDEYVTEIALNLGFTHMGRFSLEYRRHFGESPSETLGKLRRAGALPGGHPEDVSLPGPWRRGRPA